MIRRSLYRSDDPMIAGVAGGVADYFDLDPTIVRIVWLILVPLTSGLAFVLYIVMAIVVPVESDVVPVVSPWQPGGEPVSGGYPANYSAPEPPGDGQQSQGGAGPESGSGAPGNAPPGDAAQGGGPAPETTQSWSPGNEPPGGYGPNAQPGAPYDATSRYDRRWQRREERWQRRQQRWQTRMDRWEERREDWERGRRSGSIVWGLLLILVGGVLLMDRLDPQFSIARTWPLLLVGFGLILVVLAFIRGIWED